MVQISMRLFGAGVVIVVLIIVSFSRNVLWYDEGSLWLDTIAKSPNKARAYNELGLHAVQVRDHQLALRMFSRALQISPYLPQAYINIGISYEGLDQTAMAIQAYQRAIMITPDDPTAYYNLGLVYHRKMHDRDKAFEFLSKARDLNPMEPDVHQNLGVIYQEMGRSDLAAQEFMMYNRLK